MRMSMCCCGTLDGCTNCRLPVDLSLANITLNFPSAVDTGITTGTGTISYSSSGSTGYGGAPWSSSSEETQTQYISPAFGSAVQLRKRGLTPGGAAETGLGYDGAAGFCQWLWNDVRVTEWDYHRSAHDVNDGGSHGSAYWEHTYIPQVLTSIRTYTPLNATDSTSPWNRVVDGYSGTTTGCVITPTPSCTVYYTYRGYVTTLWAYNVSQLYTYARLQLVYGYPPNTQTYTPSCSDPYTLLFKKATSAVSGGGLFWVLTLYSSVNRSSSSEGEVNVAGGYDFPDDFTIPGGVTFPPVIQGIGNTTIGGWDNSGAGTSGTTTGGWPAASGSCVYAKFVDCDADLNGDPIVLEFNQHLNECGTNQYFQFASVPSTVELVLDW